MSSDHTETDGLMVDSPLPKDGFDVQDEPENKGAELINLAESVDPLLSQWSRFRDLFAEAMTDVGFWTIEDLEQRIAHRRAFFFPGANSALVGQVEVYPGGARVFQVLWAVGDLSEVVQMAPGIESLARMMGCTGILIEGREAWKRVLRDNGYGVWSVTLYKAL
jgi:hypothetical protein